MITTEKIQNVLEGKKYLWYKDRPNIIGIRTELQVPNVFNDLIFASYGDQVFTAIITTEPGITMLQKPMNKLGCALLKPGQYVNSHTIGFHKQRPDHRALIQTKPVTVYRDNDKDNLAEATVVEDSGLFGINIHGTKAGRESNLINDFSAGCQVFMRWKEKEAFMDICDKYKTVNLSQFAYTLIDEKDLK
jgi:hypothetical protein